LSEPLAAFPSWFLKITCDRYRVVFNSTNASLDHCCDA
jgi:hypothetical protein